MILVVALPVRQNLAERQMPRIERVDPRGVGQREFFWLIHAVGALEAGEGGFGLKAAVFGESVVADQTAVEAGAMSCPQQPLDQHGIEQGQKILAPRSVFKKRECLSVKLKNLGHRMLGVEHFEAEFGARAGKAESVQIPCESFVTAAKMRFVEMVKFGAGPPAEGPLTGGKDRKRASKPPGMDSVLGHGRDFAVVLRESRDDEVAFFKAGGPEHNRQVNERFSRARRRR